VLSAAGDEDDLIRPVALFREQIAELSHLPCGSFQGRACAQHLA
jgi:hypothetical protein